MAKYYYSKYNAIQNMTYSDNSPWEELYGGALGDHLFSGKAKTYTFNSSNNTYSLGGEWSQAEEVPIGSICYALFANDIIRVVAESYSNSAGYNSVKAKSYQKQRQKNGLKTSYSQGNIVSSGIIAENGTYPTNGVYSDGFWYVRNEIVNNAPSTPGVFTQPIGTLAGGQTVTIMHGASTDTDGDAVTYEVDVAFNGGSFIAIKAGSATSSSYTLPTDKSKTSVQFRVRAKDSNGAYSAYQTSAVFTVNQNATPVLTVTTADNRTLYENDVFSIDGSATDADNGNIVNVKYSLDGGTIRALATAISTGANAITFAKSLTFKGGKLYDSETALTEALTEGTAHTLRVWAEDDQGGKSAEQTRTFYVVANRPPALTIDAFTPKSSLINSDKVTLSGSVNDPENQTVVVKYKIGSGNFVEVYNGANGAFSFDVKLSDLQAGDNQITVQAVDPYGAIASKIVKLSKAANATKLLDGVQRYKVQPPKGTAKGLVMWVQAETGDLTVSANVSMTAAGVQEDFKAMTLSNTAPVSEGVVEYEFTYQTETAQENVVIELRMYRANISSTAAVKLVSGVLL